MRSTRPLVLVMLGVLALLWGLAFVGIKQVLREVSPVTLTILRFAVADVGLLALIALRADARPRIGRADWWRVAVLAVTGVPMYHLALNWGEQRTSASVASLVVATAPVMVALLSAAVLRERVSLRGATGIALAFGGVALISLTSRGDGEHATSVAGVVVAMIAPLSWAIYSVVGRPVAARVPALPLTVAQMLLGSALLLPLVRTETVSEAMALSAGGWAWVLLLGAGSSVAGYLIFVWALGQMEATRVAVFLYGVPVVAILASWAILGEPLGAPVAVAAALVVAGVSLTQSDARRPAGRPAADGDRMSSERAEPAGR